MWAIYPEILLLFWCYFSFWFIQFNLILTIASSMFDSIRPSFLYFKICDSCVCLYLIKFFRLIYFFFWLVMVSVSIFASGCQTSCSIIFDSSSRRVFLIFLTNVSVFCEFSYNPYIIFIWLSFWKGKHFSCFCTSCFLLSETCDFNLGF